MPMATGLRMGTAMRPGSRAGLGPLNTNIQVAERPVTQQGMMGMKVQAQGPGRQVMDRSYYLAELRKRCQKLSDEIHKMNTEADRYNKDNEIYAKLEKKSQTLIDEVRKLQGDLADLNLIYDKYRNSTDPKDIEVAYLNLKEVSLCVIFSMRAMHYHHTLARLLAIVANRRHHADQADGNLMMMVMRRSTITRVTSAIKFY